MKIGLSTYSLAKQLQTKQMTVIDIIQWAADQGAEHVEIVPIGYDLHEDPSLVEAIRQKAADTGLDLSSYTFGADFITDSEESYEREIARVIQEIDVAHKLGVKLVRHDVGKRAIPEATVRSFQADLPKLAQACTRVADYATQYGITTSVENHGYHIQDSERVLALVHAVDRDNFKTTVDIGNFMCADEDSVAAVKKSIAYASMVHLKDFYLRPSYRNPGEGWFRTASGNYLRGAIFGHGDIDVWEVLRVIKHSGYNGYVSIEFEGMEDCLVGAKSGMDNALRIWSEV
ncbi:sugar phosphate isomerase/epimerase family protein [Paenibacillus agricola]|uniref:Sugar phosphate isomerase/epimerase n=1 Tax=Paenibacillus agricola TaxID=2716264 RepID=A0ABX0J1W9_9BACL|nr:sugar phosphate isomerase/epimerase family protein [Paenibacillus agricola]NHN29673.1 sugar phosphate isomerase/epimerase [Paenibacillus agricola]